MSLVFGREVWRTGMSSIQHCAVQWLSGVSCLIYSNVDRFDHLYHILFVSLKTDMQDQGNFPLVDSEDKASCFSSTELFR